MCALLTSCVDLPIPSSLVPRDFAACVRQMTASLASPSAIDVSLTLRECGLRSNSCAALRTCALRGARPDTCAGRGRAAPAGFCDSEGRAVSCWHDKVLAVRDCPRGGEQCAVREGEALCTLGACPPDMREGAVATCSASGTRILKCEHGRVASLDCSTFGLRCWNGAGAGGAAACGTAAAACTSDPSVVRRCEGTTAVGCYAGHEVRIDCAAGGLGCSAAWARGAAAIGACVAQSTGANAASDAGAAATCDGSVPARCDGGASVSYCLAGKPRTYLCKSLGFARCVSDPKGARCAG